MEAKDTVLSPQDIKELKGKEWGEPARNYDYTIEELMVAKAQAEESFPLGEVSVAKAVLAIIGSPKQVNYRLKEITEYCETKIDYSPSVVV